MQRHTKIGILLASLLALSAAAQAEPTRDCVMQGTLKKADANKVYVAFHSARPAQEGARCRMRKNEKLQFKAAPDSVIQDAPVGSRVEYRYTEEASGEKTWKLKAVSS